MSERKARITRSTGNVFADMGMPGAEELFQKSDLAIAVKRNIERMHLTQAEAARVLGVSQARVSALLRGRLSGISAGKLLELLNRLGCDVTIDVSEPRPAAVGRTRITSA